MKFRQLLILTFLLPFLLGGQTPDRTVFSAGFFAGLNYNFHTAGFTQLPGYPSCCPEYEFADGIGASFGILADFPLNEVLTNSGFELRLSFDALDTEFNEMENNVGNVAVIDPNNPDNTQIVDADINHRINTQLSTFSLEPTFRYSIDNLNLYGGFKFGIPILSGFNQSETLVRPEFVVFDNGMLQRNLQSADEIPDINGFLAFISLGAGYELPLSEKFFIMPEARFFLPLNDVNSTNWNANHIRFSSAFKYYFKKDPVKPIKYDTTRIQDTLIVEDGNIPVEQIRLIDTDISTEEVETEDEILSKTIIKESYERRIPVKNDLTALLKGEINNVNEIVIEEFETEQGFPLLPYIFFKEGSSNLSMTKQNLILPENITKFNEDSLTWNTIEIYSNMLNVIGSRLGQNPESKITVIGTNNNKGVEKNNLALSEKRAAAVKDYLVNVWGISPDRVNLKSRNLPQIPGNPENEDGIKENQRAEIYSNNLDITGPVFLKDIIKKSNPPEILIEPFVKSENKDANVDYNLKISQGDKVIRDLDKSEIKDSYNWNILEEPVPELEDDISIRLVANDNMGQTASDEKTTKIKQLTIRKKRYELKNDKRYEKFALIVFDFDKADLNNKHKKVLDDIKSRIEPNSEIIIEGYTDRIGNESYNKNLSERRAEAVKSYLDVDDSRVSLKAIGESRLLFDNNTPYGRSYSRTVLITIETPVK